MYWRQLYREAVLEVDHTKLFAAIQAAEAAVEKERIAIQDAQYALRVLRRTPQQKNVGLKIKRVPL